MKQALLVVVLGILLFGCIGGTPRSNAQQNSSTVKANNSSTQISIIIGKQQNETVVGPGNQNQTMSPARIQYENAPEKPVGIYFIDVAGPTEHGNSVLIKKGGFNVLVDAGPADNVGRVIDFLKGRGVSDISVLVSTNADPRNYGGINSVADNFWIESFWWNGEDFNDQSYSSTIQKVRAVAKEVRVVGQGDSITIDGIVFQVLNPPAVKFGDINNDALVIKVTNGNFSTLITSGIQVGAQGKLANEQPDRIPSDVMVAPYYGTGAGTNGINLFLLTVKPKAVIMTGSADDLVDNGASRKPFENSLQEYNIPWYATYLNGTLRITNDGSANYSIQSVSS